MPLLFFNRFLGQQTGISSETQAQLEKDFVFLGKVGAIEQFISGLIASDRSPCRGWAHADGTRLSPNDGYSGRAPLRLEVANPPATLDSLAADVASSQHSQSRLLQVEVGGARISF